MTDERDEGFYHPAKPEFEVRPGQKLTRQLKVFQTASQDLSSRNLENISHLQHRNIVLKGATWRTIY